MISLGSPSNFFQRGWPPKPLGHSKEQALVLTRAMHLHQHQLRLLGPLGDRVCLPRAAAERPPEFSNAQGCKHSVVVLLLEREWGVCVHLNILRQVMPRRCLLDSCQMYLISSCRWCRLNSFRQHDQDRATLDWWPARVEEV